MKANSYRLGRMKTMDIETKNDNKVYIKIPLENGGFWQKEYYQNDLIEKVVQDFKAENQVDIPQDYFMDWNFKNKSLKMTDKIKTLLNQEIPTVCINQVLKKKPIKINNEEIVPDLIGKPFNDPFEVFLFAKDDKSLKIQTYDTITVNNLSLNDYSPSSAYCNGNNHLFISGGEKKNGDIIGDFWEIDLKNQNIAEPVKIPPKKNHSMIFIPNNYVFIVGGNDKKTFYFNTESAEVCEWANLNMIRTEPALERISNNLYCFDNINKGYNDTFTLEKTNLNSNKPQWILMTPKLDTMEGRQFTQKFFGVSKDFDNNIIFLGGNMDNQNINDEIFNYKYNTNSNNIEISKVPYRKYNFKEKTFLPYNKNIDYILPDFNKQHPEVVFFVKNKNKIEAIDYEPKKNNSQLKSLKAPGLDCKYDFNMPIASLPESHLDNNFEQKNLKMNINDPSFQDNNFNFNEQNDIKELKDKIGGDLQNDNKEIQIEPKKENININLEIKEDPKKDDEIANLRNKPNISKNQINQIEIDNQAKNDYTNNPSQVDVFIPKFHANVNEPNSSINIIPKSDFVLNTNPQNISLNQSTNNVNDMSISYNNINMKKGNKLCDSSISGIISGNAGKLNGVKNEKKCINIDIKNSINLTGTIPGIKPNFSLEGIIQGTKKPKVVNNKNATIGIKSPNINNNKEIDLKGPNVNVDLKTSNINNNKEIDLKGPSINVDLKSPNIDKEIDLKGPNVNVDLKTPNVNSINKDIDLTGPNVNVDLKSRNVDNNKEIDLKGPRVDVDLNNPEISNNTDIKLKGPNVKVDLKSPEIKNNTEVNLKGPKINTSDININNNIPKINLDAPKIDVNLNNQNNNVSKNIPPENINDQKLKNINYNLPKMPDFNISGNIPGKKISSPTVDINAQNSSIPNYNINGNIPGVKINNTTNKNPQQNLNGTIQGIKPNQQEISNNNILINNNTPNVNDINLKGKRKMDSKPKSKDVYLTGVIPGKIIKNENKEKPKVNNVNYDLNGNIPGIKPKEASVVNYDISGNIPGINPNKLNVKEIKEEANVSDNNEINAELKVHSPKLVKINLDNNSNSKNNNNEINKPKIEMPNTNKNITLNEIINPNVNNNKENIQESKISNNINHTNTNVNITEKNINDLNISGTILGTKVNPPNDNYINNITPKVEIKDDDIFKKSQTFVPLNHKLKDDKKPEVKNKNPNVGGNDFSISGIIQPKKKPNDQLTNNNPTGPIKTLKNFHNNVNVSTNSDIQEIKGTRRQPNYSDINYNSNINGNSQLNDETKKNPKDVNIVIKKMQILPQENISISNIQNTTTNNINTSQNVIEKSIIEYYPSQNERNNENVPKKSINNNNNNNIIESIPKINIQNKNNNEHKLTDLRFKTIKEDENNNDNKGEDNIYSDK